MKKLAILFLSAICLTACQESKEVKAEKLIKKTLNGIIVNMDTYEPIETTLDSAFAPLQTAESIQRLAKLPSQMTLYYQLTQDVSSARERMALYEDSYSSYGREQYRKYKEEYESSKKRLDEMEADIQAYGEKMEQASNEEPVFSGYLARHQYRYVNKDGEKTIGYDLFFINQDLTAIEAMVDLDDEALKTILEANENQKLFK